MAEMKDLFQSADWKKEKHVPVIECPESVKKGDLVQVRVSVGKEIAHPNTTEHHINWVEVYFLADGEKFACQIGRFEFTAHGASAQGPNTSTLFTNPEVVCSFKTDKKGTVVAASYCNIHGLWQNSQALSVA
jgi:superoxide reductase